MSPASLYQKDGRDLYENVLVSKFHVSPIMMMIIIIIIVIIVINVVLLIVSSARYTHSLSLSLSSKISNNHSAMSLNGYIHFI